MKRKWIFFIIIGTFSLASLHCAKKEEPYSAGIKLIKRDLQVDPGNWKLRLELAERYLEEEHYEEAETEYKKIAERFPGDLKIQYSLCFALSLNKKMDEALKTAEKMIQRKPDDAYGYLAMAFLHFNRGDYQKCYEYASQANKLANWNEIYTLDHLYYMAYAQIKLGKEEEGRALFQTILEKDPFHQKTLWFQMLEAFRTQKWDEVERIGKLLTSKSPHEPLYFLIMGLAQYHQTNWPLCTTYLRKTNELDSRFRYFGLMAELAKMYEIPEDWDLAACYFYNFGRGLKYEQYREGDQFVVWGEIVNLGLHVAKDTHVIVEYYDVKNQVIHDEDVMLNPRNLMPMQVREFRVVILDNPKIKTAKVSFNWRAHSLF